MAFNEDQIHDWIQSTLKRLGDEFPCGSDPARPPAPGKIHFPGQAISSILLNDNRSLIQIKTSTGSLVSPLDSPNSRDPIQFSCEKASNYFHFFRRFAGQRLTRTQVMDHLKKFCLARQQYYDTMIDLFDNGTDVELKEFYELINVGVPVPNKSIRTKVADIFRKNKKFYGISETMLTDNRELEAVFMFFYEEYIIVKEKEDKEARQFTLNWKHKRYTSEAVVLAEIIQFLRPYTNSLFFKAIEKYYIRLKTNSFDPKKSVCVGYNFKKYMELLRKQFTQYYHAFGDCYDKKSILSNRYKDVFRAKFLPIKHKFEQADKELCLHAKASPSPQELNFDSVSKALALIDEAVTEVALLFNEVNDNHQKLTVLNRRILNLIDTMTQDKESLLQQIKELSKTSFLKRIKWNHDNGQTNFINDFYVDAQRNCLEQLIPRFNGDNLLDLEILFEDISKDIAERKMHFEARIHSVKKASETMQHKQEKEALAQQKILEQENKKMMSDYQERYRERLEQHKRDVIAKQQEKESLKQRKAALIQRQRLEEEKRKSEVRETKITSENIQTLLRALSKPQRTTFDQVFSTPAPHHEITYQVLAQLIDRLGGNIIESGGGGSHRHILIDIRNTLGFADIPEDLATTVGVASGVLVKPHRPGHCPGTLPRTTIKQFRSTLERAGIFAPSPSPAPRLGPGPMPAAQPRPGPESKSL